MQPLRSLRAAPLAWMVGVALVALDARVAEAAPSDPRATSAPAEALFREGLRLAQRGETHAACLRFAESYRLDAALGTLVNLALCHEAEGRVATAWAEFRQVEKQAERVGRADRLALAREHASGLEAKLHRVIVNVAGGAPRLVVTLDGEELGPGSFGVALPLDPGRHVVAASAPGGGTWSTTLEVPAERGEVEVVVPRFWEPAARAAPAPPEPAESAPAAAPAPAPATAAEPASSPVPDEGDGARMTVGWVSAGGSVLLLGTAVGLGVSARAVSDDSRAMADRGAPQSEVDARYGEAVTLQGLAIAAASAGVVAAGVAVYALVLGGRGKAPPPRTSELGLAGLRVTF